jgi:hypothetical protein
VDLTSLEKTGAFEQLEIHQLNDSAPRACGVHPRLGGGRRSVCTWLCCTCWLAFTASPGRWRCGAAKPQPAPPSLPYGCSPVCPRGSASGSPCAS